MLQQTQVATALPYYERWMARFPTVFALAEADEQEVLSLWQGLGYYRRCKNLLAGARIVAVSGFPENAKEWRKLPGVGAYTAAAIASITLDEPVAVIDGNVERVFARINANDSTRSRLNREATVWAQSLIPNEKPGDWNQAMMELGARVCTPRQPKCDDCPVAVLCKARKTGEPTRFPVADPKKDVIELEFNVWVPVCEGLVGVRQIAEGEWWAGMWEFPREADEATLIEAFGRVDLVELGRLRHTVTHHRIGLFAKMAFLPTQGASGDLRWVALDELESIPMPAPQRKIARLAAQNWMPAIIRT